MTYRIEGGNVENQVGESGQGVEEAELSASGVGGGDRQTSDRSKALELKLVDPNAYCRVVRSDKVDVLQSRTDRWEGSEEEGNTVVVRFGKVESNEGLRRVEEKGPPEFILESEGCVAADPK